MHCDASNIFSARFHRRHCICCVFQLNISLDLLMRLIKYLTQQTALPRPLRNTDEPCALCDWLEMAARRWRWPPGRHRCLLCKSCLAACFIRRVCLRSNICSQSPVFVAATRRACIIHEALSCANVFWCISSRRKIEAGTCVSAILLILFHKPALKSIQC